MPFLEYVYAYFILVLNSFNQYTHKDKYLNELKSRILSQINV